MHRNHCIISYFLGELAIGNRGMEKPSPNSLIILNLSELILTLGGKSDILPLSLSDKAAKQSQGTSVPSTVGPWDQPSANSIINHQLPPGTGSPRVNCGYEQRTSNHIG